MGINIKKKQLGPYWKMAQVKFILKYVMGHSVAICSAFILRQTVSLNLCKSNDDCIVPMSV